MASMAAQCGAEQGSLSCSPASVQTQCPWGMAVLASSPNPQQLQPWETIHFLGAVPGLPATARPSISTPREHLALDIVGAEVKPPARAWQEQCCDATLAAASCWKARAASLWKPHCRVSTASTTMEQGSVIQGPGPNTHCQPGHPRWPRHLLSLQQEGRSVGVLMCFSVL